MSTQGFLTNYNILVLLLVAPKFMDNKNAEQDGFPRSYPSPDKYLFLTWRNTEFGLLRPVSGWLFPLPAFCPFHLLSQALHWEESNAMYKP